MTATSAGWKYVGFKPEKYRGAARQARDLTRNEYLPTYHALHNEISAPALDGDDE